MDLRNDLIALAARISIALPLIKFGTDKVRNFGMVSGWMQSIGVPAPALVLGLADTIEIVGAIFLIVGYRTRWAALVIALYLIPVHVVIHDFWSVGVAERAEQIEHFGKGMMIIGGLLFVFLSGAGALSLDARAKSGTPRADG